MWLLLLGLLMRVTAGIIGRDRNEATTEVQESVLASAPTLVAEPYYEPAMLPARSDVMADLRRHQSNAWLMLIGSVALTLVGGGMFFVVQENFIWFAMMMIGAIFMFPSFLGRLWAIDWTDVSRWDSATLSVWRVTAYEAEEDWEGDISWLTLTLAPIDVPESSPFGRRNQSWLPIRLSPPSMDRASSWGGKALVMLEREDGVCIVTMAGKHRFWRAGGDSPWDWLTG